MDDVELKAACCSCAAGGEHESEADASFEVARAWLIENPIAVGCHERDLLTHQRKCERYVVASRQQACGFAFAPILLWLIGQVISSLFAHWWNSSNGQTCSTSDAGGADGPQAG